MEGLPAESNHVTRLFAAAGLTAHTASESQALLELHSTYCTSGQCARCPFSVAPSTSAPTLSALLP